MNRIRRSVSDYVAPDESIRDGLPFWRELVLSSLILAMTILGTVAYIPSTLLALEESRTSVIFINSFAVLLIYILFLGKKLPFTVRSCGVLFLNFLLGASLLVALGPEGGGMIWLFPFPVLTGVLFGIIPCLFALFGNFIAIIVTSFALSQFQLTWAMPQDRFFVVGFNFLISNAIVCLSLTVLMLGLQQNIERKNNLLDNLKKRRAQIARSKKHLESEIIQRGDVEKRLAEHLKEKEVLLQEIHHRVKNNLQIVSGMLNLQNLYTQDPQAIEVLEKAQDRIRAMALIHDHLYQQGKFSTVFMNKYLESLINHLIVSQAPPGNRIRFETEWEQILIPMEKAIPCGLIVNELISNSLKHAFPNGREGKITVRLEETQDGLALCVGDDGVGLPENSSAFSFLSAGRMPIADGDRHDSLGLMIIQSLAGQLKAKLKIVPSEGTWIRLEFSRF
ncbi:histidine kinase dimerization/phosphoacceptor domain -containing protein [Leptospira fainei]|uniref:histidine kinase dimerization/phosphoacceptor domain -containing protein n=1 Tax=Leptospira fainei TaxID=48782 RepID=UPI00030A0FE9|nr:histidine kinase dimerization/phosphoacceptor domain -containing protein [Leptospira fainei]